MLPPSAILTTLGCSDGTLRGDRTHSYRAPCRTPAPTVGCGEQRNQRSAARTGPDAPGTHGEGGPEGRGVEVWVSRGVSVPGSTGCSGRRWVGPGRRRGSGPRTAAPQKSLSAAERPPASTQTPSSPHHLLLPGPPPPENMDDRPGTGSSRTSGCVARLALITHVLQEVALRTRAGVSRQSTPKPLHTDGKAWAPKRGATL